MIMDDKTFKKIQKLCEQGDKYADKDMFNDAIKKYNQAMALIPNPVYNYEAATWVYVAIGDSYYFLGNYKDALENFQEAQKCLNGIGNPFILLRIGECFFELGSYDNAKNYLLQAYMVDGEEVFENQEEKYFNIIKELI